MDGSDKSIPDIKSKSFEDNNVFEATKYLSIQKNNLNSVEIQSVNTASECINESRMSNESEKKKSSSASRNKPPELVPYCIDIDDCNRDEDNSSPPHLFPEGIMTRKKMNRTLPEKSSIPSKVQSDVQCIEIGDSSDEDSTKSESYKEKKRDCSHIFDTFSFKQGKWSDFIIDSKEFKKSFTNRYKPKLKEREKLKKASERMMSPPRALLHGKNINDKYKMENSIKKQPNIQPKQEEPFVVIVKEAQVTVKPCNKKLSGEQSDSLVEMCSTVKGYSFTSTATSSPNRKNTTPSFSSMKGNKFSTLTANSLIKGSTFPAVSPSSPISLDTVSTIDIPLSNRKNIFSTSINKGNSLTFAVPPVVRANAYSTSPSYNMSKQDDSIHITRSPITSLKSFKAVDITINKKPEIANIKRDNIIKVSSVDDCVDISREIIDKGKQIEHRRVEIHKTGSFNNNSESLIIPKEKNSNQNSITIRRDNVESLYSSSVSKTSSLDSNTTLVSLDRKRLKQSTKLIISSDDMSIDIKPINERPYGTKVSESEKYSSQGNIKCNKKIIFTFPKCTTVTDASGNELSAIDIIEEKGDREYRSFTKRKSSELSAISLDEEFSSLQPVIEVKQKEHGENDVNGNDKSELSITAELGTEVTSESGYNTKSVVKTNENKINRIKNLDINSKKEYENTQFSKHHLSPVKSKKYGDIDANKLGFDSEIENEQSKNIKGSNEITAGSSSKFVSNSLKDIHMESNVKLESDCDVEKDTKGDNMVTRFDRDMFMKQVGDEELFSADDFNSDKCLTLNNVSWPDFEEDEDDDDEYFTLPQRVSTGKEERDVIDGIEFLSFETERDMVEFTKIQQDFWHGSSLDDGMIQSDDGLDMMDDAFAVCGDMDMQYAHQAIIPTKTNDITKIKGWRNKQFAVNDNPASCCVLSSESYEDDDGFESCDIKIADETNMEEEQQNHWYSEDTHITETMNASQYDDGSEEQEDNKLSACSDFEKQKSSLVKDDVMLSSGAVINPEASELLKHLQSNISRTKNTKSAFVSDILDNYLSSHSQLNISYEIPKLGAEEGITHHKELEVKQFHFPSPSKPSQTKKERPQIPRKVGPKAKTLAEKRKLLEQDLNQQQKIKITRTKSKIQTSAESDISEDRDIGKTAHNLKPKSEDQDAGKTTHNLKPKSILRSALNVEKRKKKLNLDPDYKYTWVRGRPIRITGSKIFKELTPIECNPTSKETERDTPVCGNKGDLSNHNTENTLEFVKINSEKKNDKEKEQVCESAEATVCKESLPSQHALKTPESVKTRTCGIVVSPCVGYPLHPLAIKHLKNLRYNKYLIDSIWAKFSVSVVTSQKNTNHVPEKHTIPINYTLPPKNQNFQTGPYSSALKSVSDSSKNDGSESSITRSKEILENLVDEVQLEVKRILEDMVECVINHEIQDTIMKDDPDALSDISRTVAKIPRKIKKRKNRVHRELNRLDVNVIVMGEDGSGFIKNQDGENLCGREFCRLGCVCSSIQNCEPLSTFSDHCGKAQCMFECLCKSNESFIMNSERLDDSSAAEKPSLLLCTAMRLQDEENRHLAKVEKEFRHTVIQSKNQMIVVGGGSSGDGGRRKREIKLPERYRDSSVVLGKEFAIAEFKMITGDDLYSSPNVPNSLNTRRTERQLNLPNYVQVDVQNSSPPKLSHKLTKVKLTLEQKMSLWSQRYKITPCKVRVERMKGLEGVVPWCMVHLKYDCFCSGQSVKPFKKMPYRPLERPPPIPGPPLDIPTKKPSRPRKHLSRNVAVKSTAQVLNMHAHDVYRHSARTYGTTINYLIRNQSHCFNFKHIRKIRAAQTEEKPISTYEPQSLVNYTLAGNIIPAYILQTIPLLTSDEPQENANDNTEEVGFGKIVSITSLKPEEFERCEAENDCVEQDNQNGQLQEDNIKINSTSEVTNVDQDMDTQPIDNISSVAKIQEDNLESNSALHEVLSNLIPLLPEDCNDVYAVRLREQVTKWEANLKSMCKNEEVLTCLPGKTTGSLQVIKWSCLLDHLKSETFFLWLQYKHESIPKFLLTESRNKPDQNCIAINADKQDCKIDLQDKLPLSIIHLLDQLYKNKNVPLTDHSFSKENIFGLLHFDGENWELIGSFLRECGHCDGNVQKPEESFENIPEEQDKSSIQSESKTTSKQFPPSEIKEILSKHTLNEVMDSMNEVSETWPLSENSVNTSKEVNSIVIDENAELREIHCEQGSSLRHVQNSNDGASSNHDPVMNESTVNKEDLEKLFLSDSVAECSSRKVEVDIEKKTNLNITVNENVESETILNESLEVSITNIQDDISNHDSLPIIKDNEKSENTERRKCVDTTVNDSGMTDLSGLSVKLNLSQNTEPFANDSSKVDNAVQNFSSHNVIEPDTKPSNEGEYESINLVSKEIKDKSGMTTGSVLCMTVTLPPDSETDTTTHAIENESSFNISELDFIQNNDHSENKGTVANKMEDETGITTESALDLAITFSPNSEANPSKCIELNEASIQNNSSHDSKHESSLNVKEDKDEIANVNTVAVRANSDNPAGNQNSPSTNSIEVPLPTGVMPSRWFMLIIKYKFDLLFVANSLVRYAQIVRAVILANSHGKTVRLPLDNPAKESHESQPKFGVYAVPNLFTRVFIGPYGLREEAGVSALKVINGKLVNVMYKDLKENPTDVDQAILSIIGSGQEAALNKKMEEMCDKNARALSKNKVCRGMWLCSNIGDRKGAGLNSSDMQDLIPENKSQVEAAGKMRVKKEEQEFADADINKMVVDNGTNAQENSAEIKKLNSRRKQIFALRNDAMMLGGLEKEVKTINSVSSFSGIRINSAKKEDITIIKDVSDSEDELLDVETPCNTGKLFREEQLRSLSTQMQIKQETGSCPVMYHNKTIQMPSRPIEKMSAESIGRSYSVDKDAYGNSVGLMGSLSNQEQGDNKIGITGSGQELPILSIGKTAVSIKLVPSIPSVGYVTASMYHNKTVLLNNPFTSESHPCYFQTLDTTVKWLTDELKSKLKFVPDDLEFRWKIRHSTVKLKDCNPFNRNILYGQHILTEKGVTPKFKMRNEADYVNQDKSRRKELLECFHKLGSTFLTKKQLQKTNKYTLLKMAFKEIKKVEQTNTKLVTELAALRNKRITNFAKFFWKVKALPSSEERKNEMNKLIRVFEKETDQKPVFDIENITREAVINDLKSSMKTEANTTAASTAQKSYSHDADILCEESFSSDYLSDEKVSGNEKMKKCSEDCQIKAKDNADKDKLETGLPLRLKNERDESVSMSIFVVNGDDPLPAKQQPDKDIVTVTRIPQGCTDISGSSYDYSTNINKSSNNNQNSLSCSSSISDICRVVQKKARRLSVPNILNKNVDPKESSENISGLALVPESLPHDSQAFMKLSKIYEKLKEEESKQKEIGNFDEESELHNIRETSGFCYSLSQRKSLSLSVDSNEIKNFASSLMTPVTVSEDKSRIRTPATVSQSLSGITTSTCGLLTPLTVSQSSDGITSSCGQMTPITVHKGLSEVKAPSCSLGTPMNLSQSLGGIRTSTSSLVTPINVSQSLSGLRTFTPNLITPVSVSQSLSGIYTSTSSLGTPVSASQSLSRICTSTSSLVTPVSASQSLSRIRTSTSNLVTPVSASQSLSEICNSASSLVTPVSVSQSLSRICTSTSSLVTSVSTSQSLSRICNSTSSLVTPISVSQSLTGICTSTSSLVTPVNISQSLSGMRTSLPRLLAPVSVSQSISGVRTSSLIRPFTILKSNSLMTPVKVRQSSKRTKTATSSTLTPVTSQAASGLLQKFEFKRKLVGPDGELDRPPKIRLVQKMTSDGKSTLVPTLVSYRTQFSGKSADNTAVSSHNNVTDKNGDLKSVVYSNSNTNSTTVTTNSTSLPVISSQHTQPGNKLGYHLLTNSGVIKPVLSLSNIGQIKAAAQSENSPSFVKILTTSGNVEVPITAHPGAVTSSQQTFQADPQVSSRSLKKRVIKGNQVVQLQTLPGKTLLTGNRVVSLQGNKKAQYVICNGKPILLHNSFPLVLPSQLTSSNTVIGNVPVSTDASKISRTSDSANVEGENMLKLTNKHQDITSTSNSLKHSLSTQNTESDASTDVDGVVKKPAVSTQSSDIDTNKLESPRKLLTGNFGTSLVTKKSKTVISQPSPDKNSVEQSLHSHSVFSVTDSSSSTKTTLDIPIDSLSVVFSDNESVDGNEDQDMVSTKSDNEASKGSKLTASTSTKCLVKKSVHSTQHKDSTKRSNKLKSKKLALKKKAKSKVPVPTFQPTRMVTRSKSRKKYQ